MHVLIKFEDDYGCYSLFKYCASALNNKNNNISGGWGCNGVFSVDDEANLLVLDMEMTHMNILFDSKINFGSLLVCIS